MYKVCKTCDLTKQEKSFHKNIKGRDGLRSSCKDCEREKRKSKLQLVERKCNTCKRIKPLTEEYFISCDSPSHFNFTRKCLECIKTCNSCGIKKELKDFPKNNFHKSGYANRCKSCQLEYLDKYGAKKSTAKKSKYRRERNSLFISRVKMRLGCQCCGYKEHPSALDFDHIDPSTKNSNDYSAMNSNWSRKRIKEGMRKCRVLCANCHRIHSHGHHYSKYPGLNTPTI